MTPQATSAEDEEEGKEDGEDDEEEEEEEGEEEEEEAVEEDEAEEDQASKGLKCPHERNTCEVESCPALRARFRTAAQEFRAPMFPPQPRGQLMCTKRSLLTFQGCLPEVTNTPPRNCEAWAMSVYGCVHRSPKGHFVSGQSYSRPGKGASAEMLSSPVETVSGTATVGRRRPGKMPESSS